MSIYFCNNNFSNKLSVFLFDRNTLPNVRSNKSFRFSFEWRHRRLFLSPPSRHSTFSYSVINATHKIIQTKMGYIFVCRTCFGRQLLSICHKGIIKVISFHVCKKNHPRCRWFFFIFAFHAIVSSIFILTSYRQGFPSR